MKSIKVILCMTILFCLLSLPSYAINICCPDYDNDEWNIEKIEFTPVDGIPDGWIPLRKASEFLPFDVSWDAEKLEVVVFSHVRPFICTSKYKSYNMPHEFIIKDGVTYCHPRMIAYYLWDLGFMYDGEVYYIAENSPDSKLIKERSSAVFERKVLSAMLEIKLKLPEDYAFIRKYLTGGIQYVTREEVPRGIETALGYICPSAKKPICYVVGDTQYRYLIANTIAHEAHHVWEYQNGGVDEASAHAYGDMIRDLLQAK